MSKKDKRNDGPYHVARKKQMEAWAYNETSATVSVYVRDVVSQITLRIPIRKETLRRLAALK